MLNNTLRTLVRDVFDKMTKLEHIAQEEFIRLFFKGPKNVEILNKFMKYRGSLEGFDEVYDTDKLIDFYSEVLDSCLNSNLETFSGEVLEKVLRLAESYSHSKLSYKKHDINRYIARQYARLYSLIKNPEFIRHEISLGVMEELADIKTCEPWDYGMFTYAGDANGNKLKRRDRLTANTFKKTYLKDGFGAPQIEGFFRLIKSERVWNGDSEKMKTIFFYEIGKALGLLADKYPVETFEPRISLIENSWLYGYGKKINFSRRFYNFKTQEELKMLGAKISSFPNSPLAQRLMPLYVENIEFIQKMG